MATQQTDPTPASKKLYDAVAQEYELPAYEEFLKDMSDPTTAKKLHAAIGEDYELPEFNEFYSDMGFGSNTAPFEMNLGRKENSFRNLGPVAPEQNQAPFEADLGKKKSGPDLGPISPESSQEDVPTAEQSLLAEQDDLALYRKLMARQDEEQSSPFAGALDPAITNKIIKQQTLLKDKETGKTDAQRKAEYDELNLYEQANKDDPSLNIDKSYENYLAKKGLLDDYKWKQSKIAKQMENDGRSREAWDIAKEKYGLKSTMLERKVDYIQKDPEASQMLESAAQMHADLEELSSIERTGYFWDDKNSRRVKLTNEMYDKVAEQKANLQLQIEQAGATPEGKEINDLINQVNSLDSDQEAIRQNFGQFMEEDKAEMEKQKAVDAKFAKGGGAEGAGGWQGLVMNKVLAPLGRVATDLLSTTGKFAVDFVESGGYTRPKGKGPAEYSWGDQISDNIEEAKKGIDEALFPQPTSHQEQAFKFEGGQVFDEQGQFAPKIPTKVSVNNTSVIPQVSTMFGNTAALLIPASWGGRAGKAMGLSQKILGTEIGYATGLMASSYVQSYQQIFDEAINAPLSTRLSRENAAYHARTGAAIESILELVSPQKFLGAAEGMTAKQALRSLQKNSKNTLIAKSKFFGKELLQEEAQETLQTLGSFANKWNTNAMLGRKVFEVDADAIASELGQVIPMTAIMVGGTAGPAAMHNPLYAEAVHMAAADEGLMTRLRNEFKAKGTDQKLIDKVLGDIANVVKYDPEVVGYVDRAHNLPLTKEQAIEMINKGNLTDLQIYNDPEVNKLAMEKAEELKIQRDKETAKQGIISRPNAEGTMDIFLKADPKTKVGTTDPKTGKFTPTEAYKKQVEEEKPLPIKTEGSKIVGLTTKPLEKGKATPEEKEIAVGELIENNQLSVVTEEQTEVMKVHPNKNTAKLGRVLGVISNVMKQVAPNSRMVLVDTEEDVKEIARQLGVLDKADEDADVSGFLYHAPTKTAFFVRDTNTALHEAVMHPLLTVVQKEHPEVYEQFVAEASGLLKEFTKEGEEVTYGTYGKENYDGDTQQQNEAVTHFLSDYVTGQIKGGRVRAKVREIVEKFLDLIGVRSEDLSINLADPTTLRDFAEQVSTAIRRGKTIKIVPKAETKKAADQVVEQNAQASKRRPQTKEYKVGITSATKKDTEIGNMMRAALDLIEKKAPRAEVEKLYTDILDRGEKLINESLSKVDGASITLERTEGNFFNEPEPTFKGTLTVPTENRDAAFLALANVGEEMVQEAVHISTVRAAAEGDRYGEENAEGVVLEPDVDFFFNKKLSTFGPENDLERITKLVQGKTEADLAGYTLHPDGKGINLYNIKAFSTHEEFKRKIDNLTAALHREGFSPILTGHSRSLLNIGNPDYGTTRTYEGLRGQIQQNQAKRVSGENDTTQAGDERGVDSNFSKRRKKPAETDYIVTSDEPVVAGAGQGTVVLGDSDTNPDLTAQESVPSKAFSVGATTNSQWTNTADVTSSGSFLFDMKDEDGNKSKGLFRLPYEDWERNQKITSLKRRIRNFEGLPKTKENKVKKDKLKAELATVSGEVLTAFKEVIKNNLRELYATLTPEFIARGKEWYVGANRIAQSMGKQFGLSIEQAGAMLAALSPQSDWFNNISAAKRVAQVMTDHQDTVLTKEIRDLAIGNIKDPKSPYPDTIKAAWRNLNGKSLSQLPDTDIKAIAVRMLDHAFNDPSYNVVNPEGVTLGPSGTVIKWNSDEEILKSIFAFNDGSPTSITKALGFGNKVRNFYNNIVDPNSPKGHVTGDTHAFSAGMMAPASSKAAAGFGLFGGGANLRYTLLVEAYQEVAKEVGLMPRELQSVLWEAQRTGVNNSKRTKQQIDETTALIEQGHEQGIAGTRELAKQIIQANRSTEPEWARFDRRGRGDERAGQVSAMGASEGGIRIQSEDYGFVQRAGSSTNTEERDTSRDASAGGSRYVGGQDSRLGLGTTEGVTPEEETPFSKRRVSNTTKRVIEPVDTRYPDIRKDYNKNPTSEDYVTERQSITKELGDLSAMNDQQVVDNLENKGTKDLEDLFNNLNANDNFGLLAAIELLKRATARKDQAEAQRVFGMLNRVASGVGQLLRQMRELKSATNNRSLITQILLRKYAAEKILVTPDMRVQINNLVNDYVSMHEKEQAAKEAKDNNPTAENIKKLDTISKLTDRKFFELMSYVDSTMPSGLGNTTMSIIKGNLLTIGSVAINTIGNVENAINHGLIEGQFAAAGGAVSRKIAGKNANYRLGRSATASAKAMKAWITAWGPAIQESFTKGAMRPKDLTKFEVDRQLHPARAFYQAFIRPSQLPKRIVEKNGRVVAKTTSSIWMEKALEGTFGWPAALFYRLLYITDKPFKEAGKTFASYLEFKAQNPNGNAKQYEDFMSNMDAATKKRVDKYADKFTYNDADGTIAKFGQKGVAVLDSVTDSMKEKGMDVPAAMIQAIKTAAFPYVTVPSNVVQHLLEVALPPLSLYAAAKHHARGNHEIAGMYTGRAAVGVMLYMAAGALAQAGLMIDSDDDKKEANDKSLKHNVARPNALNLSGLTRMLSGDPNTEWREGDRSVDMGKLGIFGMYLGAHANFAKAMGEKGMEDYSQHLWEAVMQGTGSALKISVQMPFMKGSFELLETIAGGDKEGLTGVSAYTAKSVETLSNLIWPNQVAQLYQASEATELKRASAPNFLDNVQEKMAKRGFYFGALDSDSLSPVLDIWGQPIPLKAKDIVHPLKLEVATDDEAIKIWNLVDRTNQDNPLTMPQGTLELTDSDFEEIEYPIRVKLQEQDYLEMQAFAGRFKKAYLRDVFNDPDYEAATDQEKLAMISEANLDANRDGRQLFLDRFYDEIENGSIEMDFKSGEYKRSTQKVYDSNLDEALIDEEGVEK